MRRTPVLAFLLVTVFIDALGLGLVVPIVPGLLRSISTTSATAAQWSGIINSGYGLAQFLAAPLLGRLADRYGRRPVLVLALTLLGFDYLAHAVAISVWPLVLAHALAGAFAGTMTAVNAAIADITAPPLRPRAYGRVAAVAGLAFVGGPAAGGLLGSVSLRMPFYVAAGLAFANALYGLIVLPESRRGDRRTSLSWRVANPVSSLGALLRRPGLRHVTVSRLLGDIARVANQVAWVFVMTARFGWSAAQLGLVLAVSAVAGAVVSARLSGPLVARLGVRRAAILCAAAGTVSLAGFATVPLGWLVVVPMAIGAVAAVGGSATLAWLTGLAGGGEQGTVQGAVTGIAALAETVVPVAATAVFAWSLTLDRPGLVLLVAAGICAVGGAVLVAAEPPASAAALAARREA